MTMKAMDTASTTKANATRPSAYTIHTNKDIEHLSNKPTTTSMNNRQEYELSALRTFCRLKAYIKRSDKAGNSQ